MELYKCDHEKLECPNHEGALDCTPFCLICEGEQEYCPAGCEPIFCNSCGVIGYADTPLTKTGEDFYQCEDCLEECTEPAPESIAVYRAHFTGTPVAACTNCRFITSFFECSHDLQHNCEEYQ
jgi:hypothetical protein